MNGTYVGISYDVFDIFLIPLTFLTFGNAGRSRTTVAVTNFFIPHGKSTLFVATNLCLLLTTMWFRMSELFVISSVDEKYGSNVECE